MIAAAQKRFALGNRWHALSIEWAGLLSAVDQMQDDEANHWYRILLAKEFEIRGEEVDDKGIAPAAQDR